MIKDEENRVHFRFLKSEIIHCYTMYYNDKKHHFDPPISIIVEDISIGGMGIITKHPLEINQVISFYYTFEYMPYKLMLKVIWIRKIGKMYKVGLEFVATPNGLVKELKEYLKNISKD